MRKIIILFLFCSIAYFLIGWYGQTKGWLTLEQYLTYGGIVGGLASVFGLFGFLRPPMSRSDIQNIELESLKKVVEASEEIERLEAAQSKQLNQIDALERQKKEMEFLVRKASMSLFLQERRKYLNKQVLSHLNSNEELKERVESLVEIDEKLDTLEQEIEKDPNVEQLKKIISHASISSLSDYSSKSFKNPLTKSMFLLMKSLDEVLSSKI